MKPTIYFFLFLLITRLSMAQKPIAYYKFDNSAKDYSGNSNDGTLHGGVHPTMDRFGNFCGAYLFDGSTGYIEVPTSPSLEKPSSSVTFTAWYRLTSKRSNYWLTVTCKGATSHESADNPQYRFQVQQDFLNSVIKCGAGPGFSTVSLSTESTVCDNQYTQHPFRPFDWCFYALVYNGKKVTAYMNDIVVYEADYDKPLQKNNAPLYIGLDEPGTTEYFEGALDDVYIFDEALDAGAVKKLYNEQRPNSWDKEELVISPLPDKTVNIPAGQTEVKVSFNPPTVTNNGCGKTTVTQIWGQPSGTSLPAGRYLVVYQVASEMGYEAHTGFYITIKGKQAAAPSPPPPAPKPVPTPGPQPYLPKDIDQRETIEQQRVEVSHTHLKLVMYDNAQYDGDTVSIFLNKQPVVSKQEVTIPGTTFFIDIDSTNDNLLVLYAENLGSIPPNTALLVLYDGDVKHELFLSSSLQQNAAIRIRKKKP